MNKVSIIIPCYNQGQYLPEALQSVMNQTYTNWECIIVNDGSLDNTAQVAQKWLKKDARFIYAYKENGGLSSARNNGLNIAKGSYIQFLDSDDFLDKEKIELSLQQLTSVSNKGIQVVISNFRMFTDNAAKSTVPYCNLNIEHFNFESLLYKWGDSFTIPIHCGFFNAGLFENFRFPEELKAKEDWVMWVSIFHQNYKAVFLDLDLALYRKNSESMTMRKDVLPDYIKACDYLKGILTEEEFINLLMILFARYYKSTNNFKAKLNLIKSSNSYVLIIFIKKALKKTGFLNLFRKVFIMVSQNKSK